MGNPAVSVIIPTHNRAGILEDCLRSLFVQTLPGSQYEIIVIDDGSSDDTQMLLSRIATEASLSFTFFKQDNRGPGAARNLGIKKAQGEIIYITGDDIIASESLLEKHLDSHKKNNNVAVLGKIEWHPAIEVTDFMSYIMISGYQFGYKKIKDHSDVPFGFFYTANISLPKNWFHRAGYFDESFPYASFEDIELGYRMEKNGLRIIFNDSAIAYHKHVIEVEGFCERQRKAGESGYIFYRRHPELASKLQVGRTRLEVNLRILFFRSLAYLFKFAGPRKYYYSSLLMYHFSLGVKERMSLESV